MHHKSAQLGNNFTQCGIMNLLLLQQHAFFGWLLS